MTMKLSLALSNLQALPVGTEKSRATKIEIVIIFLEHLGVLEHLGIDRSAVCGNEDKRCLTNRR